MLVLRIRDHSIVTSLATLVQAWLVAERTNHRFVIDWPGLPSERVRIKPFFDYHSQDARGATEYTPLMHPIENNIHLLQYYYRRIFTQIFLIVHPTLLPYANKHIVLWGAESFSHADTILRQYWNKTKFVYRFAEVEDATMIPDPQFTAGMVGAHLHEQVLPAAENWSTFLHLAASTVIVSAPHPFVHAVVQCFRNKEHWIVHPHVLALVR